MKKIYSGNSKGLYKTIQNIENNKEKVWVTEGINAYMSEQEYKAFIINGLRKAFNI